MAAFDAICSAQKGSSTRRLEPYLSLPYLTLPSEGADAGAIACIFLATSDAPMGGAIFLFATSRDARWRLAHDSAIEARRARLQRPYPAPTDSFPPCRACLPSFGARATYGEDLILG
jgi:hypothetical protein